MNKSAIFASIALLSASTLCYGQALQSLNKHQATKALSDKTFTTIGLITLDKKIVDNTATIYLDKTGKINGQMANKPDGLPQTDQGTWTIKDNGTLCATWQNWNQSKPICVSIYELNNSLIFVNADSHNLETLVLKDNIKAGNQISS